MSVVMRGTGLMVAASHSAIWGYGGLTLSVLSIIKRCIRKRAGIKHEYVNAA